MQDIQVVVSSTAACSDDEKCTRICCWTVTVALIVNKTFRGDDAWAAAKRFEEFFTDASVGRMPYRKNVALEQFASMAGAGGTMKSV